MLRKVNFYYELRLRNQIRLPPVLAKQSNGATLPIDDGVNPSQSSAAMYAHAEGLHFRAPAHRSILFGMADGAVSPAATPSPEMNSLMGGKNAPTSKHLQVSVIVPALNEEDTIALVVDRVLALPLVVEIIVINDGSTDRTGEILASYGNKILVLTNEARQGKGAAIRQALPHATGEVIVIQDADLEYLPEELPLVVQPILENKTNVVLGTRFLHGLPPAMALPNKVVNVLLAAFVRLLFGTKITDEATCYKAVRREVMLKMNLQCKRFEFCPEVVAKALRMGERPIEVPISYTPRNMAAGKKIRWTDAPDAFWTLLKYRFWKP